MIEQSNGLSKITPIYLYPIGRDDKDYIEVTIL